MVYSVDNSSCLNPILQFQGCEKRDFKRETKHKIFFFSFVEWAACMHYVIRKILIDDIKKNFYLTTT